MKTVRNIAKLLIGIALIPAVMAALHTMGREIVEGAGSGRTTGRVWVYMIYGMGAYVVVHLFFHKFIVSYVFSKDPVRRLWGAITGYKPPKEGDKNMQTTDDTGRRPHFLARMAPFLFPIYTILAVVAMVALDAFEVVHISLQVTCFVVGLTYMFHLFEVGYDMKRSHPDLAAGSMVLSVVLIVLINLQVIVGILDLAVPRAEVSYVQFNKRFLEESKRWYTDTRQVFRDTFGL